jgi:carbamoyl-phosphate synthase small subunit
MKCVISTTDFDHASLVAKAKASPDMAGSDYVQEVTIDRPYEWNPDFKGKYRVVALDYGIKYNILRRLEAVGCKVIVMPATATVEAVLAQNPDGVFLSNGPGDPAALPYVYPTLQGLVGKKPIFGICLGHQVLGHALGGSTFKLKFGHRGGNQPVLDHATGKVEISSQNHGFAVDPDSFSGGDVTISHINLNDQSVEGLQHTKYPVFSVQYHPEAAPGPAATFSSVSPRPWTRRKRPARPPDSRLSRRAIEFLRCGTAFSSEGDLACAATVFSTRSSLPSDPSLPMRPPSRTSRARPWSRQPRPAAV